MAQQILGVTLTGLLMMGQSAAELSTNQAVKLLWAVLSAAVVTNLGSLVGYIIENIEYMKQNMRLFIFFWKG